MPFPPDKDKEKKPPAGADAPGGDPPADAPGGDKPAGDGEDLFDDEDITGDETADSGEGEEEEGGVKSPIPDPGDQDTAELISKAAAVLAEHTGLTIEPSEDPLEFLRHIITAAATHSATKSKIAADQAGQQTGLNGQSDQATEEQRPYLMSVDNQRIELSVSASQPLERFVPEHRAAALLYRQRAERSKANRLKMVDRLEKSGMPRYRADELRSQFSGYLLSLDAVGGVVPQKADEYLRGYNDAAKDLKGPQLLSTLTGKKLPAGVRRQQRPGSPTLTAKQVQDDQEHMIRLAGLPVPAK